VRGLPEIDLPALEFAEFARLRLREKSLRMRSRYGAPQRDGGSDSWARFGEGLGQLRDALSRLGVFDRPDEEEAAGRQAVSVPSEGFRAYIEWMSGPADRKLLFSPPMERLWGLGPGALAEPLVLVFKVNAEGEVVDVQSPLLDDAGLVAEASAALRRYRFEPSGDPDAAEQQGALLIGAERHAP
ncbi:MAG: hypothetical protein JXR94_21720, partial [Candidatus Hydrogenedentes bacterium]|nr:hypothetical protein [Candidatus Hydrogenedentota bacterium]